MKVRESTIKTIRWIKSIAETTRIIINKYKIIELAIPCIVFLFSSIFTFINSSKIINFIVELIPKEIKVLSMQPFEIFSVSIFLSIFIAFIICIPIILYLFINYINDALYKREKNIIKKILLLGSLLFITGGLLACFVFIKIGMPFFAEFNSNYGIETVWSLQNMIDIIIVLCFSSGLMFEIPIIIYYLIKYHIIEFKMNYYSRVIILLFLLTLFAFLTPDGSMATQLFLTIPIYTLLEIFVYFGNRNMI